MKNHFETIEIEFDALLLERWKQRDPNLVPAHALDWKGPGVSNGYGFGEWFIETYLGQRGYSVIRNDFNLISKKSKYETNNAVIRNILGTDRVQAFGLNAREFIHQGGNIENIDLFVYSQEECYFAEVKKGRDILRSPQIHFMWLALEILGCPSKVFYLKPI